MQLLIIMEKTLEIENQIIYKCLGAVKTESA
jgi:hypothetical protein